MGTDNDEDLDICADCEGSTAPGSPDPHECTAPLTAETITDEQIRKLWRMNAGLTGRTLMIALGEPFAWGEFPTADEQRAARARCAEILNARRAGAK